MSISGHSFDSDLVYFVKDKYGDDFRGAFTWKIKGKPEQLSDQGIALLSYIYAQKDGCMHQPLFADSEEALDHFKEEMLKTEIGTEATVIVDFINKGEKKQVDRKTHRETNKLIHTADGLILLRVDSTEEHPVIYQYSNDLSIKKKDLLRFIKRQVDGFSCGVFAIKDARVLNREIDDDVYNLFELSQSQLIKSSQMMPFARIARKEENFPWEKQNEMHIRKRHDININLYTEDFAKKFCGIVQDFLNTHSREEVINALRQYDAAEINFVELNKRFSERKLNNLAMLKLKVENVLKFGKNPNRVDSHGKTLLYYAVQFNDFDLVELLLKAGADPRCIPLKSIDENKPLTDLFNLYLDPEKNINLPDEKGETQLFSKIKNSSNSLDDIKKMLDDGANPNLPNSDGMLSLSFIIRQSKDSKNFSLDLDLVKILLEHGAKTNIADSEGCLPLCLAASFGRADIVDLLLKSKANPNKTDISDRTALSYAVAKDGSYSVSFYALLDAGAWPIIVRPKSCIVGYPKNDPDGFIGKKFLKFIEEEPIGTPRFLAVQYCYTQCFFGSDSQDIFNKFLIFDQVVNYLKLLKDTGSVSAEKTMSIISSAWDNYRSSKFETLKTIENMGKELELSGKLLLDEIKKSNKDAVIALCNMKVDPNSVDELGKTALHYAVSSSSNLMVAALLANNAILNIKDVEGKTPLLLAAEMENEQLFALLLSHYSNNVADDPGTALGFYVFPGIMENFYHVSIISELMKTNINKNGLFAVEVKEEKITTNNNFLSLTTSESENLSGKFKKS